MSQRQRRRRARRIRHDASSLPLSATGGLALAATLLSGGVADAATTFTVTSDADAGAGSADATHCTADTGAQCTLRDAIAAVNAGSGGDTIVFASTLSGSTGNTITLTGAPDAITEVVTVQGHTGIVVDGNAQYQGILINVPSGTVEIDDLSVENGKTSGEGGGIDATGAASLRLDRVKVAGSQAFDGGGIYAAGPLTVVDSTIEDNSLSFPGDGAGIYTDNGQPVTITGSTIANNGPAKYGGGASIGGGDGNVIISDSTISGNEIENTGLGRTPKYAQGGGLYLFGSGTVTITGSTIAGNHEYAAGDGQGGGIFANASTAVTLQNTIVSGNTATSGPDISGPVSSAFSLINDHTGATIDESAGGNLAAGTDPLLGALADNGGPNQTMKPASNSPVIDAGKAFGLSADQRGLLRPFDATNIADAAGSDGSDLGAVELHPPDVQGALPSVDSVTPPDGPGGTTVVIGGSHFTGATQVLFGTTSATFTFTDDGHITATVPAGLTAGTVDVRVITDQGESPVSAGDHYTTPAPTQTTTTTPTTPPPAHQPPPAILNLRENHTCVRQATLHAPFEGTGGLSFGFDLTEGATVQYKILRRIGSPRWTFCPTKLGHVPGKFKSVWQASNQQTQSHHNSSVATIASRPHVRRQRLRAGRHGVAYAKLAAAGQLTPGTYLLELVATNANGSSTPVFIKFFVLKP